MLPPFVYFLAAKAAFRAVAVIQEGAKAAAPQIKKQLARARQPAASGPGSPGRLAPENIIALVGGASAGKSSLGNALLGRTALGVGVEHGTTARVCAFPFRGGYQLQDTPGLLDGERHSAEVFKAAKASALVVLVTAGSSTARSSTSCACSARRSGTGTWSAAPARRARP